MADYISEDKINSFKEEIDYIMFNILRSFTYKFCSGLFKSNTIENIFGSHMTTKWISTSFFNISHYAAMQCYFSF